VKHHCYISTIASAANTYRQHLLSLSPLLLLHRHQQFHWSIPHSFAQLNHIRLQITMDSITLTRSPAKSSIVPKLSTLRRKGAEVFSSCAFSSNNPWDPNDSELEDQVLPSESTIGQDMDSDSPSPTGSPPAPQTTLTAGMSSLRDPRRRSAPSTHSSPIRTGDEKLDEEDKWVVVDSPAIKNNV
jgi:hypothetical protein